MHPLRRFLVSRLILIGIIFSIGAFTIFQFQSLIERNYLEREQLRMSQAHSQAISEFKSSIGNFATFVAGLRSYILLADEMPQANALQEYINLQLEKISYNEEMVVSFIDTSHVFQYVFTRTEIDPAGLAGKSVRDLRDPSEMPKLYDLLQSDDLHLFDPMNIREGWLGIPIDFRVVRNGQLLGYVAPILNLRIVLDDIYEDWNSDEYLLNFRTKEGLDFDRQAFYNDSPVFSSKEDEEYYKKHNIDTADFQYRPVTLYGKEFSIGIARKTPLSDDSSIIFLLFGWFTSIIAFAIIVVFQIARLKKLNHRLFDREEQLKGQYSELETVNTELDRFVYKVTHDLKSPLSNMDGLIQLTKNEKDASTSQSYLQMMETSSKKMRDFIDELIIYARNANEEVQVQEIDMKSLLEELVEGHQFTSGAESIHFEIKADEDASLSSDPSRLRIVMSNLISNAIKYHDDSKKDKFIKLHFSKTDHRAILRVEDNGLGMKEEDVSRIFDMFYRTSTSTSAEGTGIGLYLVKEAVEKVGGSISTKSSYGEGTVFTIEIPQSY